MPFRTLPIGLVIENSKKREENSKKSKNTIVASFQAKIGWKRLRERKEKLSFRFVPTRRIRGNSKKKGKKIQKIKKPSYGFFSSRNRLEKAEKKRK